MERIGLNVDGLCRRDDALPLGHHPAAQINSVAAHPHLAALTPIRLPRVGWRLPL